MGAWGHRERSLSASATTESGPRSNAGCTRAGPRRRAFAACSCAASHTASGLADGGYGFEVRGVDAVGNVDASRPVGLRGRRHRAQAAVTKQPPKQVKTKKKKAKVTFSFAVDEPGARFRCSLEEPRSRRAQPGHVQGQGRQPHACRSSRSTLWEICRRHSQSRGRSSASRGITGRHNGDGPSAAGPRWSRTGVRATRTPSTRWAPTSRRSTPEPRGSSATSG